MRNHRFLTLAALAFLASAAAAQTPDYYSEMHWREVGPTRAGRARALSGVASQPNVFYVGFDNGGVWRSTDYGSTWQPLFDKEGTGSIGAIAVAPSDPNIIYVGSGAGIIRPDLAVGDGMYKSTDAGRTWTHLGLHDTQMIAQVEVDPNNPNRLFVAALGHPYGPNAERGVFRSTDGGTTFQKVLYKDEYTSANDVRIDPNDPNTVYAALWQQQQSFIEGDAFGGASGGIFKSTDGGTTWTQLTSGLPTVLQANLAVAPSNSKVVYAMLALPAVGGGAGAGALGIYKSTDAGATWTVVDGPGVQGRPVDARPLGRIGGGDLATLAVDPMNENVVYSSSTVMWRSEDGGQTWSAVRGAPGGDDYQKTWINPKNGNILLQVSDQGAVVSANRGASWSNWYTQPTAAMYHVTTDMTFVYRVCGGQQDSGSACVDSRSMDGEITFHDWHPVNIQEYGIAAPDPKDPDMVYGSSRTGVSLYNRKTGQTTSVGPSLGGRGGGAGFAAVADVGGGRGRGRGRGAPAAEVTGPAPAPSYNRNVRTMPIAWSPVDPNVLFYVQNAVYKSSDHAHSWTRISGDLTRPTWDVPATAGKYASNVTPGPRGTITALSPSPRSVQLLWAGTDDGNIQVTTDGGATWKNVTPAAIKPWTRIFNIDAGHFDDATAYAAANTMRIDDLNPHFWRTHDGGKTWTEIDNGVAAGAVVNSIREDPRVRGLLYGASDTQMYVSFDDGDHWQSLRLNMPAISVRDVTVKDDSVCMCSDLVIGTHGRGFWILDDVTPLRQEAQAQAADQARIAYLFKPVTAVRVRFATNDPTPWPPEVAAGENPQPGGIIDYYLGADASGPVTLEILDGAGRLVRSYSSDDPAPSPNPAQDPEAYNKICQQNPMAADCGLPLYWPAPPTVMSTRKGMHRFAWDLHYNPIAEGGGRGGGGSMGAVPHRTYPSVNAPWAPPGSYTVRLTANGQHYTQPITLKLDPRVRTPATGLAQMASLSREMYEGAAAAHAAYGRARALVTALDAAGGGPDLDAFKAQVESLAPVPAAGGRGGRGGRGGGRGAAAGGSGQPTLESLSASMIAAAMPMQSADVTPTAGQIAAVDTARAQDKAVMAKWTALSTTGLALLNAKRKGQPPIGIPK